MAKARKEKRMNVDEGGINAKHNITGVALSMLHCANNIVIFTLNRGSIITAFTKTVGNIRWLYCGDIGRRKRAEALRSEMAKKTTY